MKTCLIIKIFAILTAMPALSLAAAADDKERMAIESIVDKPGLVLNNSCQKTDEATNLPAPTIQNKQASDAAPNNQQDAQKLFEESLRQMMPLDNGQIQKFREHSDRRERALLPVSPALASRTVRVSLEPGQKPVSVFTTANVATSLVFHDSTGQAWPITSVTNGSPAAFQVLRPELPDGNLLNVIPLQGYAASTLVVTLENRDVPLAIKLESDSVRAPERKADALVLLQLAHHGPRASVSVVKNIRETANSTMLSFLDRVPPENAVRLKTEPATDNFLGWEYQGKNYLRTTDMLVWPAWSAVANGAGDTKCYEVEPTSRVMLSINGAIHTVILLILDFIYKLFPKNKLCCFIWKHKAAKVKTCGNSGGCGRLSFSKAA